MARRRKTSHRKRGHVRRRRGIGKIKLMPDKTTLSLAIGVAGGAVASSYIAGKLASLSLDPKIKAAILAAGGILVAGQSNPLIKGVGLGIAGAGAISLANSFNLLPAGSLSGTPSVIFNPPGLLSGFNNYPNFPQANTINGFNQYPNTPQMNAIGNMAAAGIF